MAYEVVKWSVLPSDPVTRFGKSFNGELFVLFTSVRCWGWEFVELYLHSPYIFTA
jgi:hypothetical protein